MKMERWNVNQKPSLEEYPKHYCFCWTSAGGPVDLSGKVYDSFSDAVTSQSLVKFLHGGCAAPFGPCRRETKSTSDSDCYEQHNWVLKKHDLLGLFFCNPENLDNEDKEGYKKMASIIWRENA